MPDVSHMDRLATGANFGHNLDGVMEVVKPATYRKRLPKKKRKIVFKLSGRPSIAVVKERRSFFSMILGGSGCDGRQGHDHEQDYPN